MQRARAWYDLQSVISELVEARSWQDYVQYALRAALHHPTRFSIDQVESIDFHHT